MVLMATMTALKEAERIKEKIQFSPDITTDAEAWLSQQQLQRLYQQVLILDLEYALDKKIEQDLWNHGFKNYIASLQAVAKDKMSPRYSQSLALLTWCLEAASGFYLTLLQEICSVFELDLPFRRKSKMFGCNTVNTCVNIESEPNKSSCYYICQYCLVHLGDIARYRNQTKQAEAFYRHAVQLAPSSGQPYNQLAILEASRSDKLGTVYHYVRAVMLKHPFPVATTNLTRMLTKHAEDVIKTDTHTKLSSSEYVTTFLKLHGLVHMNHELDTVEKLVQILTTSLTAHLAMESLSCWKLVQMLTINVFAFYNVVGNFMDQENKTKKFTDKELTEDDIKIKLLITDLLAASLSAFLLPVYTIKLGEPLLDYFALPAIKLTLDWIQNEPDVLHSTPFKTKLQIWPSLCKLLNDLQACITDFSSNIYSYVPLPEDRDLQGFLPFDKPFENLKFTTNDLKPSSQTMNKLRGQRLIEFGLWLSRQTNVNLISAKSTDTKYILFEPVGITQAPTGEQIREFEELSLTKLPSPSPSESSEPLTGSSTPDNNSRIKGESMNQDAVLSDKRSILKQQQQDNTVPAVRGSRNVAMQAIFNKSSDEKQVTFKTPSPVQDSSNSKPIQGSPNRTGKKIQKQAENKKPKQEIKKDKKQLSKEQNQIKQINQQLQSQNKKKSEQGKKVDNTLLQQQRLMDVLAKTEEQTRQQAVGKPVSPPFNETLSSFPPLPGSRDKQPARSVWSSRDDKMKERQAQHKQQLLSDLFNKSKMAGGDCGGVGAGDEQHSQLSGLLNLSKQQQQMLTDSKHVTNVEPAAGVVGSGVSYYRPTHEVNKIEGKKEFENIPLLEQPVYPGNDRHQYEYERCFMLQQPPPAPPPVYIQLTPQPVAPFTYKVPTPMYSHWQDQELQPPMPPSWWSEEHAVRQQQQQVQRGGGESVYHTQHDHKMPGQPGPPQTMPVSGNTYSLFSTPSWNTIHSKNDGDNDAGAGYGLQTGIIGNQSFWSGPGPSPLERLLEQQKQMRESPSTKSGT